MLLGLSILPLYHSRSDLSIGVKGMDVWISHKMPGGVLLAAAAREFGPGGCRNHDVTKKPQEFHEKAAIGAPDSGVGHHWP